MRVLVVLGMMLIATPAVAQESEKREAADQILNIFKAVQQRADNKPTAKRPKPAPKRSGATTIRAKDISAKPLDLAPEDIDQVQELGLPPKCRLALVRAVASKPPNPASLRFDLPPCSLLLKTAHT